MAKRAKANAKATKATTRAAGGRLAYELGVRGGVNTTDERFEAELTSPALDPAMHPAGVLRVNINTDVKSKPKTTAVLDSFHVESLADYLRGQGEIRAALEKALVRDQREWDPEGPKVADGDVWRRAKVESLELRRRKLASPELVAHLKHILPPKIVKLELADCDAPGTRSSFTVVLECDWDDEHSVRATFRDGRLVDVDHV